MSATALDKCLACFYLAQAAEQFYKNYAWGAGSQPTGSGGPTFLEAALLPYLL